MFIIMAQSIAHCLLFTRGTLSSLRLLGSVYRLMCPPDGGVFRRDLSHHGAAAHRGCQGERGVRRGRPQQTEPVAFEGAPWVGLVSMQWP